MVLRVMRLVLHNIASTDWHLESSWYSWPLMTGKWIEFWNQDGRHILCVGNLFVWYPVFVGIVISALRFAIEGDKPNPAFVGYFVSFVFSSTGVLYDYAVPLMFGCLNLAMLIDQGLKPKVRAFVSCFVGAMAVFGYILWSPWAYGLTTPDFDFLVWNSRWKT